MKSQITIKKIQDLLFAGLQTTFVDDDTSRRMWWAALEVVQKDFLSTHYHQGGVWVASPLPALNEKRFFTNLQGWLWSPNGFPYFKKGNAGFLPPNHKTKIKRNFDLISEFKVLNLSKEDGYEPFLMILTPHFQCLLTIVGEQNKKALIMRCDEKSLKLAIELMNVKFSQENHNEANNFRNSINNLGELNINDQFAKNFWPNLSSKLGKLNSNFAVKGKLTIHFVIINQVEEFNPCKAISLTVRMKSYSKTYRPSL